MLSNCKRIRSYILVTILVMSATPGAAFSVPLAGQIIPDPANPSWLIYYGDGPHFLAAPGDPEDFLYRGSRNSNGTRNGDQMSIINKLKATGANGIYLQAIRSHGGDGDSTHNPFVDNDPAKGVSTAVLDQWESWFTEMDNNGIVVFFFFYDDSATVWNTSHVVEAAEKNFMETLVNRFKHHKHLIWVVAEEYDEAFTATRVSNIAAAIRAADDRKHAIAVHKRPGLTFEEFANDPNIDQFAIQLDTTDAASLHTDIITGWNNAAGRYNLNMVEAPPGNISEGWGSGTTARHKAWAVAMGGAYVMAIGMDVVDTATSDLEDLGRLVRFMESTNFNEMAPHDELAFGGTQYVLAKPGHSYIAYASNLTGDIGLRNMTAGKYDFKWFDPVNGATVIQTGVTIAAGNQSWSKPSSMGNEVALHVKISSSSSITNVFPSLTDSETVTLAFVNPNAARYP